MKRHTRPYGCTHPQCYVRHGSRSDWLRHEKGQHHIPETWLCNIPDLDAGGRLCNTWFRRGRDLKIHLVSEHGLDTHDVNHDLIEAMRLGADARDRFWCGFCVAVVPTTTGGGGAPTHRDPLDLRCAHIGDHFDKDDRNIDDWVCVEAQKAKRTITPEERRRAREGRAVFDPLLLPSGVAASPIQASSSADTFTGLTTEDRALFSTGFPLALAGYDDCDPLVDVDALAAPAGITSSAALMDGIAMTMSMDGVAMTEMMEISSMSYVDP